MQIKLSFPNDQRISMPLTVSGFDKSFALGFKALQSVPVGEIYGGPYSVVPKVLEQTLETAKKTLIENVTIKEIPFFEVSNNSGGTTVFIGGEIEAY